MISKYLPKYIFLALISLLITIIWISPTVAQFDLLASSEISPSLETAWWEPHKARVCGNFWCSNISLIGSDPLKPFHSDIVIAAKNNLEQEQSLVIARLESRAKLVESTIDSIFDNITTLKTEKIVNLQQRIKLQNDNLVDDTLEITEEIKTPEIKNQELENKQNYNWLYWLPITAKTIHPLTPQFEIGILNKGTVIYIPDQPQLNLRNQTIITITEDDATYNGQYIEDLAKKWQKLIYDNFSNALWGFEFNRRYPYLRPLISAIVLLIATIPILAIFWLLQLLKKINFYLKIQLQELQKEITENAETNSLSENAPLNSELNDQSNNSSDETIAEVSIPKPKITPEPSSFKAKMMRILVFFWELPTRIRKTVKSWEENFEDLSLQKQNSLKQIQNLVQLLSILLFWIRFFIVFFSIATISSIYPISRRYEAFFFSQGILIPLIWMLVGLGINIAALIIDYNLNEWAKEAQANNPSSQRPILRVNTYSSALKGASIFLFSLVGIYLTVSLIGIDPQVFTQAGFVALAIGFLSRNVLEDMLNGALILWSDRYAIGDIINVGDLGGYVENMNLYITQLRGAEGRLITIPNSQIGIVQNLTKDWSRFDFEIKIALDADVQKALQLIEQVGIELQEDPEWQEKIIEPPIILGVDQISYEGVTIKMWLKTQPIQQWSVGREFRLRLIAAFEQAGIKIAAPQKEIWQYHS